MSDDPLSNWRANPCFVLGVDPQAPRLEIERAGQKLLALLTVESASAADYETPLGPGMRDADAVRQALGILRDPDQRLAAELWAEVASEASEADPSDEDAAPWDAAFTAIGWRVACPSHR